MIGDVDDIGVVSEAGFIQRLKDAAEIVVDERDLAVGVGDDLAQLLVGLRRDAGVGLAQFDILGRAFGFARDRGLVPPGAVFEIAGAVFGQVHVLGRVETRPGFGGVKRVMRVGEADPGAERIVAPTVAQPFDGAVRGPGGVMPGDRQL